MARTIHPALTSASRLVTAPSPGTAAITPTARMTSTASAIRLRRRWAVPGAVLPGELMRPSADLIESLGEDDPPRGLDQREMRERLREIAQMPLAVDIELLDGRRPGLGYGRRGACGRDGCGHGAVSTLFSAWEAGREPCGV